MSVDNQNSSPKVFHSKVDLEFFPSTLVQLTKAHFLNNFNGILKEKKQGKILRNKQIK